MLALAVALIGGPTTMATAQPLAPVASVKLSTVMATPAGVTGSQLKAAPAASAKVYNFTKAFTTVKATTGKGAASVVSIHRQTKVEVLSKKGSWTKVRVSGKTGFLPTSVLGKTKPTTVSRWVKGKQPVFQSFKTSSKKLGTLGNNTKITWLRNSGSWQQVRTSAGIGWMPSSKLSNTTIKPHAKSKVYSYTKSFTTVKAKAYRSSANLISVHRQTKVEVLQNKGSWTKVRVSGKVGFVPTSALSKTNPTTVSRWVKGKQPVYVSAKTSSRKLSTLSNNTKITWLRTSGSWQQVRTSAGIGWMPSSALSTKVNPAAHPKPPVKFNAPRWTTDYVNLRTGPGTSNRSVGTVPKGERVLLASSVKGWANVKTSRGTGWISMTYLSTVAPTQKPPTPDAIKFDSPRWTTTNLNLRKGAGTNHEALGVVPMGERVLRGRSSNGWANIKTSKGIGWVSEIYLATTAPPPKPTTQYRWATGNVNLRAGGSTIYPIMGVVQAGDRVTYLGSRNGWANVVTNVGTGWMSDAYLSKKQVAKLQPDTIAVNNAVKAHFGSWVTSYGGVRPGSVGHSSGRATDLMIKDYKSPRSIKNGDKIADFLIANRKSLGISYLIWQDKIWLGAVTGWEEYSKSGKYGNQFVGNWNDTTLHLDHIHAETIGNAGTGAPLIK
ncbi:SH3 domain-containing protein [Paeniglutamicibacter gangotriensis]|uniref:SH3 domain-containing protein n=1 Tax=Paeniglutamicibacter gangotriensis TaxID=254787 RepID=A0A5B0EI28_9MICC|nr:SH3 domain-containing protein [Paeniglutamicibacter gangotriensis]KAA0978563.1 SH3 domain-containing protein [Paeniglutamicibacter gangotriensis]